MLKYIYHDCFLLETQNAVMIFDYWKDPLAGSQKDFPPLLDEINTEKHVYVIVSHHHKDHFTRRIFLWSQRIPNIKFIISRDVYKAVEYMLKPGGVYKGFSPDPERVVVMSPGDVFEDKICRIQAFASTDIGNSYVIKNSGLSFCHAGDLNAWLWINESTQKEIDIARVQYTDIIDEISSIFPKINLVMFPVDSRLGPEYWWGAKYLVHKIKVDTFVPMHFELVTEPEDKEIRKKDAGAFLEYANINYGEYVQLAYTRSSFFKTLG